MASRASLGIAVPPHDTANWYRILHTLYKIISAVLYLLDFGSNIYSAYQYRQYDYRATAFEGLPRAGIYSEGHNGIFISMVSVMAVGHISWAIVFKLVDFPREKHPLVLAYCFPFVQLQRVLCSLFNRSSKGSSLTAEEKREEARVEALYAIVSATTDGGPLFLLQYLALAEYSLGLYMNVGNWSPPVLLIVSLCLSAASATWNVTRAIIFLVPWPSKRLALAAGAFTLSALTVRCTTLVSLVTIQAVPKLHYSRTDYDGRIHFLVTLGIYLFFILLVAFSGNLFLTWEGTSKFSYKTLANSTLRAVGFTYVSVSFGPLYPLVSVAQTNRRMGVSTKRFQHRLFFYAACRLVLETTIMAFLVTIKWSPCSAYDYDEWKHKKYDLCRVMPCFLYKVALAVGLGVGILSAAACTIFLTPVPTGVHPEDGEITSASDAALESLGITVDVMNCYSSCLS